MSAKQQKKSEVDNGRRKFLHGSALVGVGAVAASVLPEVPSASADANQPEQPLEEGYRLTKHIKDYYKTAAS